MLPSQPIMVEAEKAKISRSEARKLKDEEESVKASSWAEAWRIGGKAKVAGAKEEEVVEDPKVAEARKKEEEEERQGVLERLAKAAGVKKAAAEAGEGEAPEGEAAPKKNKIEEAKALLAKEKEKAKLKKQQQEEAKKAQEVKKQMAKLDRDLNKDAKRVKRY
mmetsp:Transcript_70231/g.124072  ORF Transcript_70231/g.124072 Transcript_70231/m.124072 type:complete len:163 (+) Transcript_70231:71-559(+)